MISESACPGSLKIRVPKGHDAEQLPGRSTDVDVVEHLRHVLAAKAPCRFHGFPDLRLRRQGRELGRHQPAGGLRLVLDELANFLGSLGLTPLERREQSGRVVLLELLEKVDAIVGVHFAEELDRPTGIDGVEHEDLTMRAQAFHDVGGDFGGQRAHQRDRFPRRQVLEELGDVFRVKLRDRLANGLRTDRNRILKVRSYQRRQPHRGRFWPMRGAAAAKIWPTPALVSIGSEC